MEKSQLKNRFLHMVQFADDHAITAIEEDEMEYMMPYLTEDYSN